MPPRALESRLSAPLLALCAGLLAGCATSPYQPYAGTFGYSEVNIAKNRYEVMYQGNADLDDATAKKYAIVRAAEIGKQNGYTHFRVAGSKVRQETSKEVTREPDLFPRLPWSPTPRRMTYWELQREQDLDRSRTRVRVETSPVVQLTIQYFNADCDDCLSVETKLAEARAEGLLKR